MNFLQNILTRLFSAALLLSTAIAAQGQQTLPDFGDSAGQLLSKRDEQLLGQNIMQDLWQRMPLLQDDYASDYLNLIGKRLAAHSSLNTSPFHFFWVKADSINAFALPGGNIGVHTALILRANTESELAGVLAHEIAHVSQRHIARMYEQASKLNIPTIAAVLGSIALATQNPTAGTGALAATVAGAQQYAINFTRENEQEADRIGIQLMTRAGFNAQGMPDFFQELQKSNRFNKSNVPDFLQTHPVTIARIAEAESLTRKIPQKTFYHSQLFGLIKARIDVLVDANPQERLAYYHDQLKNKRQDKVISRYGYSLALLENNRLKEASTQITLLLKSHPNEFLFQALAAELALKNNQGDKALACLKELRQLYPDNRAITLQYVRTLLQLGQAQTAYDLLRKLEKPSHFNSLSSYQLLAEAAAQTSSDWQAHHARAEYLLLLGDKDNAIKQLKMALSYTQDNQYLTQSLKAQLQEVEETVKP